jgi:hypothetical protein
LKAKGTTCHCRVWVWHATLQKLVGQFKNACYLSSPSCGTPCCGTSGIRTAALIPWQGFRDAVAGSKDAKVLQIFRRETFQDTNICNFHNCLCSSVQITQEL